MQNMSTTKTRTEVSKSIHMKNAKKSQTQKSPLSPSTDLKDESKLLHIRKTVVLPKQNVSACNGITTRPKNVACNQLLREMRNIQMSML